MPVKCIFVTIPNPSRFLSFAARIAFISSAVKKFKPSSITYMYTKISFSIQENGGKFIFFIFYGKEGMTTEILQ